VVVGVKNSSYGVNSISRRLFLELKAGKYTLVFSQIGLETQEHAITITDEKTPVLDVVMKSSSKELSSVEITAKGNRDREKKLCTMWLITGVSIGTEWKITSAIRTRNRPWKK